PGRNTRRRASGAPIVVQHDESFGTSPPLIHWHARLEHGKRRTIHAVTLSYISPRLAQICMTSPSRVKSGLTFAAGSATKSACRCVSRRSAIDRANSTFEHYKLSPNNDIGRE